MMKKRKQEKGFFPEIELPVRTEKPRDKGLTMMIDWGLSLQNQENALSINAPYSDFAKIAVGIPRMISENLLKTKISLYKNHDVEPFPGGMLLELAMHQYRKSGKGVLEAAKKYFEESARVGFEMMEVSDNVITLSPEEKAKVISTAVNDFGFTVFGEVGTKREVTDSGEMLADIKNCLDSGSWKAILEAMEFVDRETDEIKQELIDIICGEVPAENLMFEIPGTWNSHTTISKSHDMTMNLIHKLGNDANIGNIMPDYILELETLRLNIGVGMKLY